MLARTIKKAFVRVQQPGVLRTRRRGVLAIALVGPICAACNTVKFAGDTPSRQSTPPVVAAAAPQRTNVSLPKQFQPCSKDYEVPATANPYLAGMASGSSLTYKLTSSDPPTPTDKAGAQSPVLVTPIDPTCIVPGATLAFTVSGTITHNNTRQQISADGNTEVVVSHQLGATNGMSDITAPIDSLVGVFIGDGDPSKQSAPGKIDFSSAVARNYSKLEPKLGQVFFIGTGKNSSGDYRQVVVPAGAKRLYFATMDTYQWNNNAGGLKGAVLVYR